MSSSYSSLDWVLSQWAHFTVHRFICVYLCVFCVFLFHTAYSLWARPKTGTTRVAISTIHFCKADILGFLKSPVGRVNVVA